MITRENTKTVVRYLTGFGAGATAMHIVRSTRARSDNKAVDTLYDASAVTTGYVAGYALQESLYPYSDEMVDKIFDFFEKPDKTTPKSV